MSITQIKVYRCVQHALNHFTLFDFLFVLPNKKILKNSLTFFFFFFSRNYLIWIVSYYITVEDIIGIFFGISYKQSPLTSSDGGYFIHAILTRVIIVFNSFTLYSWMKTYIRPTFIGILGIWSWLFFVFDFWLSSFRARSFQIICCEQYLYT